MLIVFSGLPGTGKTTIARELARVTGAVHLRIDSIEQPMRDAGIAVEGQGYAVAYARAEDSLRAGRTVIADCVNPWRLTREAWHAVAERAEVKSLDVEIVCSDADEHRRRVETRSADIAGHQLPSWQDVVDRDYYPWDTGRLVVDTARASLGESVQMIITALAHRTS